MSFFDNPKNGPGALATRLATDSSAAQGVKHLSSLITFETVRRYLRPSFRSLHRPSAGEPARSRKFRQCRRVSTEPRHFFYVYVSIHVITIPIFHLVIYGKIVVPGFRRIGNAIQYMGYCKSCKVNENK
jgi:hypothetical protein